MELKRVFAALAAVVTLTVSCSASALAAESTEKAALPSGMEPAGIGRAIEDFVEEHRDTLAGMAVSVFEKDSVLYEGYFGYTDKEAGLAVDEESVFEWGSATKTLVWVSVMQQVELGKIDLAKDVREYLPENFLTNTNKSYDTPVTMLNLMNHTAGYQDLLVDLFIKEKDKKEIRPLGEQLKRREPVQVYEPGTITAYSNWGVALAGYIVECVSGQDFCEYVHENIFAPLGMEHSALAADLGDNSWVSEKRRELQCYTADGALIPECFYYISLYPAGMCTSTLGDMRLWAAALAGRDGKLLSADTWSEFYEPTSLYTGTNVARNCHGLWTELRSSLIVGHGGNTAGCSSYILIEPLSGLGAVVMTNQQNEEVFNECMMDLIFGPLDGTRYFDEEPEPPGAYRVARTILAGPFKLYGAGFTGDFADDDSHPWHYAEDTPGGTLVQFTYTDYIRVSGAVMILEIALFLGAPAAVLAAAVILTAKLICGIVGVVRKSGTGGFPVQGHKASYTKTGIRLRKWQVVSCLSVVLAAGLVGWAALQAQSFGAYDSYRWCFYGILLLMIFMASLLVYGISGVIRFQKEKAAIRHGILNIMVLVILSLILVFMGYFQLWRIWII